MSSQPTYTDADVRVLQGTYLTQPPGLTEAQRWEAALAAVAPAIAARALRDAADAIGKASPSQKFAPGWLAAEMGLRARAADIGTDR